MHRVARPQLEAKSTSAAATLLGLLRLWGRLLLRRCRLWRLRSRFLTASTGDCPTDNGDNDDERGNNSEYLVLGHVLI